MRKLFISLTMAILSMSMLTACAEENEKDNNVPTNSDNPTVENDTITMVTSAKDVNFEIITISEGDSITVDWGDGKIQSMRSIKELDHDTVYNYIAEFQHTYIDSQSRQIKIKTNQKVAELTCRRSGLVSLNTGRCTSLTSLDCQENLLTTLEVSGSINLTYLDCYNNSLATLDVSKNTKLINFACHKNQLSTLNVSTCANLTHLWCNENKLTVLDISKFPELIYLGCSDNKFTESETNKIYNALPNRTKADNAMIAVSSPYGDYSIAENKGWRVQEIDGNAGTQPTGNVPIVRG